MSIFRSSLFFSIFFLSLTACGQDQTQNQSKYFYFSQWIKNMTQDTCKNLHKVTDIDDLIGQMYNNIDNHCLFDMPTNELEAVWDLKIFDFTAKLNDKELNALIEKNRSYDKDVDALYISKKNSSATYLQINATEIYLKRNNDQLGGSLKKGKFPDKLPKPDKISGLPLEVSRPIMTLDMAPKRSVPEDTVYDTFSFYWWLNKDRSRFKPFLEITTGDDSVPANPVLYKNGLGFYMAKELY